MIEINLVPLKLRKRRKGQQLFKGFNIPLEVVIGLGGGFIVLLMGVHLFLLFTNVKKIAEHKRLKKEWALLEPDKSDVDAVISELRSLKGKQQAAEDVLVEDKISWSQKLNILSDSLPKGVWLRKIILDEEIFSIEGSAVSTEIEEMINVHSFAGNLKKQKKFLEHFEDLELGSIQRRKINKVEIADFVITARLK